MSDDTVTDNSCKLDIHSPSSPENDYYIHSDLQMDLAKTRRNLRTEKHKRWASMDNVYPFIMLLIFLPEVVLDIEEMSNLKSLAAIFAIIMIALNMMYVLLFVLTTWSMYRNVEDQKDAVSMYYYWHTQQVKMIKPVVLLSLVIVLDLFLGIALIIVVWYGREHRSSLSDCIPVLTSTYVWLLANMIPFAKGWTQFKSYVWIMGRYIKAIVRGQFLIGPHASEIGRIHNWDKDRLELLRDKNGQWTHNEHVETGNCVIESIHLAFTPELDGGTISYRAWTISTWTGDYFHMWPSWTTARTQRQYKCKNHRGLLPNDFILHLLKEPYDHVDLISQFKLDTPLDKDDLPDKISLLCAA